MLGNARFRAAYKVGFYPYNEKPPGSPVVFYSLPAIGSRLQSKRGSLSRAIEDCERHEAKCFRREYQKSLLYYFLQLFANPSNFCSNLWFNNIP